MSRFRMYPTPQQEQQMLLHCAHARYVWNLAVEQHSHWYRGRKGRAGLRRAVQATHRSPARQRVARQRERGRSAASAERLRPGQERQVHLRVR
ncbi:helix-turn-helix domain-containing protein [Streptomyces mirabilis]|uniref:helix-turn-helix domain-containing protein n=1 Tax=Streptomyces mirabilis TaxID=68239 RepID=UPI0033BA7731